MGRLQKVNDAKNKVTAYKYDSLGNVSEKLLPNGIKTEYTYDELSRLNQMTNYEKAGKISDDFTYTYDAVGNKTEIIRNKEVTGYRYDDLNQLGEVQKPNNTVEEYFYDTLGNRVRHERWKDGSFEQASNFRYDIEGKLSEITGKLYNEISGEKVGSEGIQMEYDQRGNLVKTSTGSKVLSQYTFDAANQMVSAVNSNGTTNFTYDGFGRRVSMESTDKNAPNGNAYGWWKNGKHSVGMEYVLDITAPYNDVLMVYGNEGKTQKYTYGLEVLSVDSAENKKSDQLYYLQDELGSPIRLVDEKGKTAEAFSYDEFGRPLNKSSKTGNIFSYTGYQYDDLTGLMYAQARYYMPEVGRFVSEDSYKGTIDDPQTLNLYAYCANNPLSFIDPNGNVYLIAWSYGRKDVKEFEQYLIGKGYKLTVDGDTKDWNKSIFDEFTKRSSFARAAYTNQQWLINTGIAECDIDIQRIDNQDDLAKTWEYWLKHQLIEGLDFYSHGYDGGAEVYGGSGDFWEGAKKLKFGSSLRNRELDGKQVAYISSSYAAFYGCNTANGAFAQKFANNQNVTTYAQTDFASFSNTPKYRNRIDTHGTSRDVYLLSFESWNGLKNKDGLGKRFIPERE